MLTSDHVAAILNDLCDLASQQTVPRFRAKIDVVNKLDEDFDPVTEADREAERSIRDHIGSLYPDHGIVGEEFGRSNPESPFQWIIDPIDGTRAFISGIPVWGTLIGLYENGKPIAGVMDQPFTGERYMATGDQTSLFQPNGEAHPLQTSAKNTLGQATLMTTSPHLLQNDDDQNYFELEKAVNMARYGCDCYAYCLLAAGHIDLVVESGLNVYDIAALIPIIENAGGSVTNWQGGDATRGGQILAAANPQLKEQAIHLLSTASN